MCSYCIRVRGVIAVAAVDVVATARRCRLRLRRRCRRPTSTVWSRLSRAVPWCCPAMHSSELASARATQIATCTNHCSMSVTGAAVQELQSTYGVFAGVIFGIGGGSESSSHAHSTHRSVVQPSSPRVESLVAGVLLESCWIRRRVRG